MNTVPLRAKVSRCLYSGLFYLGLPLVLWRLKKRARQAPAYGERIAERFGHIPARQDQPLWIHAVSVGETVAIAPLVEQLLAERPELPLLITSTTPTGSARVKALFGERVSHGYAPYDLPHLLRRFLNRVQPRGLLIVETELWPNTIAACHGRNIPVLLANARLSARSARGYQKVRALSQPMVQQLSCVAAQDNDSGQRFIELGLPTEQLTVTGSIKFDQQPPADAAHQGQQLRQQWGEQRPVLVAGSTRELEDETEETALLQAYATLKQQHPDLLLVLVPRHPERFESVYQQAQAAGWQVGRRSDNSICQTSEVVIGDTMGELASFYAAADLCFVGGSLVETGGHNPLEPAMLGKPVLMGPHLFNFSDISQQLQACGGLSIVDNPEQLSTTVEMLLTNPDQARQQGLAAQQFIQQNQGALARLYRQVCDTFELSETKQQGA